MHTRTRLGGVVILFTLVVMVTGAIADEQINIDEHIWQQDPMVARAPDGRTVYVWDGNSGGRIRLYDASGHAVSEKEITFPGRSRPDLAVHDDGDFVVVWTSNSTMVSGQRFTATGEQDGPQFLVNSTTDGRPGFVDIAGQPDEGFAVVWEGLGFDGDAWGIAGRVFDGMGQPVTPQFVINTEPTGFQRMPAVESDGQGNFLVVWLTFAAGSDASRIMGRWYDAGGAPIADDFVVVEEDDLSEIVYSATVAVAESGETLVVWTHGDNTLRRVEGRFYNGVGAASEVMQISTFESPLKYLPQVAVDESTGEFFVVWESRGQDSGGAGVFGRWVGADGVPLGDEIGLSDITAGNQSEPAVAFDASGEMALVWQHPDSDGPGIFGNCLREDGCPVVAVPVFGDGFESGGVSAWSASSP